MLRAFSRFGVNETGIAPYERAPNLDLIMQNTNSLSTCLFEFVSKKFAVFLESDDLPLLFTNATYPEESLHWQTSPAAQADLIRHFQRFSAEHTIRAVMVRNILDHIEARFPMQPMPCHQLDRIVPECRWRGNDEGKGTHKPIAKRPVELTIEEKQDRAKRKKCDLRTGDNSIASDQSVTETAINN
ncbi:unnamed protein product [Echinostoma caproni]|uniref:Glycosyltransferase family 92 protein n=1 Tax=Echinostoma caproni TaxID=27848 RepID=A0A183A8F7_9TREM|nr:unnamed protein product [Echinostoma caproni]